VRKATIDDTTMIECCMIIDFWASMGT